MTCRSFLFSRGSLIVPLLPLATGWASDCTVYLGLQGNGNLLALDSMNGLSVIETDIGCWNFKASISDGARPLDHKTFLEKHRTNLQHLLGSPLITYRALQGRTSRLWNFDVLPLRRRLSCFGYALYDFAGCKTQSPNWAPESFCKRHLFSLISCEARGGTCSSGGAPGIGVSSAYVIVDLYQEAAYEQCFGNSPWVSNDLL